MTPEEFIFDLPLYTKVIISESHIIEAFCNYIRVDGYNSIRSAESTFQLRNPMDYPSVNGVRQLHFVCQRYNDDLFVLIHYDIENDYIEKVGQYPSMADIHISQVKRYRKVLGESYIRDFTRAIGLAANGVGTGSFVYLRRVFEHLIDEIAAQGIKRGEIDESEFKTSKMDNRIKLLSQYLPDVVIDNKPLYGVLSAGIHELSEEQCLRYFSIVRSVVELVLDEMEHERVREVMKKEAKDKLAKIAGEVRQKQ